MHEQLCTIAHSTRTWVQSKKKPSVQNKTKLYALCKPNAYSTCIIDCRRSENWTKMFYSRHWCPTIQLVTISSYCSTHYTLDVVCQCQQEIKTKIHTSYTLILLWSVINTANYLPIVNKNKCNCPSQFSISWKLADCVTEKWDNSALVK